MSYRSVKRLLGEKSLERKCHLLFGVCLFLLIAGSFYWYGTRTDQLVFKHNPATGRLLVDTILVQEHFRVFARNEKSGAKAPVDGSIDMMIDDIDKRVKNQIYEWRLLRPNGLDHLDKPLAREDKAIVERFRQDPEQPPIGRDLRGEQRYEYYQPVFIQAKCVKCHSVAVDGERDIQEGDLVAVAKVTLDNRSIRTDINWNRAWLIATGVITMVLAMAASFVIVRYVIVKPLRHLRDVSDAVSRGDLQQRAQIRTADEFEELGVAFNRMLQHLLDSQEEFRKLNADLDVKVDELAQANMQLFEVNRLKSDFLATMSHELRTPLNSIIGFSDVLGSIASLDDKQKRYVLNIQKSGKMLLDMINDILDLAKVESGKMELRLSEFRVEQVIAAQCDMARPLAERKNIDLEIEIEPRLPTLWQDQVKTQQILGNLLSNAIKFTPDGGRVVVSAAASGPADLRLTVADTGVGISEEDQARIFEKFRQGKTVIPGGDAMTREYSGTGLGLSIVKEMCKLLGGEVSVKSELGKGSVFTVRLPFVLADASRSDSLRGEPTDEEPPEGGRSHRDDFVRPLARASTDIE